MAVPSSSLPIRAPALYFAGRLPTQEAVEPFTFRLPCPPAWDDRRPGAWAAERRARRAYFATLDALRTGTVDVEEELKARRLLADLRSASARGTVTHFLRIMEMVRLADPGPILPTPAGPLCELEITAPPMGPTRPDELAARYRWALEWLDARRFVAGKGLRIEWRVRRMTSEGVVVVPADARLPGSLRNNGIPELTAR